MAYTVAQMYPLMQKVFDTGGRFRLYPHGTSMLPLIRQGKDFAELERLDRAPRRGDILLYKRDDGTYVLHRVWKAEKDGTYTMLGDSQTVPEHGVRRGQMLAVVTGVGKNGAQPTAHSTGSALYRLFWCTGIFVRRAVFYVKRHFTNKK